MAVTDTHVIGDYTAAITIDGSTHFMLIQPGNASTAYRKISRNVLLGVTGQPADISTSQSFTNKTLDNTNILNIRDDRFTLQDSGDVTKQAQFQLSGITTATTRTYTLPNASSTLADISTAQTFTNKTLTNPVITGGSITGTTITTDAIVGQTSPTSGTIYGLPVSSSKVGTNGIVTASITDGAVTPAKLVSGTGSSWTWQSWTVTTNNFTTGTGTWTGYYTQIGKTVFFQALFVSSATSSLGSNTSINLPVNSSTHYTSTTYQNIIGEVVYGVGGSTTLVSGKLSINSLGANKAQLLVETLAGGTYVQFTGTTASVPSTITSAGNFITIEGSYEAA